MVKIIVIYLLIGLIFSSIVNYDLFKYSGFDFQCEFMIFIIGIITWLPIVLGIVWELFNELE